MDPLLLVHSKDKETSCLLKLIKKGFKLVSILRLEVRSRGLTIDQPKKPFGSEQGSNLLFPDGVIGVVERSDEGGERCGGAHGEVRYVGE